MSVPYHTLIQPAWVYNTVPPAAQGWICPQCHGVYAPFVPQCFRCCNQANKTWPATSSVPITGAAASRFELGPDGMLRLQKEET